MLGPAHVRLPQPRRITADGAARGILELVGLDQEVAALCRVTGLALPPITYEGSYLDDYVGFCRIPVSRHTEGCHIWSDEGWHLAMRGGPYTAAEREALLDYCQSDVDALTNLLPRMLPAIDFPCALLRGRYMAAAARMEWAGVPIDTEALHRRFIFEPATWLRCLIWPGPGQTVAYIDDSQQELAIAAALSGDQRMQDAYASGDFYLTFTKMAGAVPAGATKQSHAAEREQFKTVALGVLYGLSAEGLVRKLNVAPCRGRELLRMHQETFRGFWAWSDRVETEAMLSGQLRTAFGWTVHVGRGANPRSLRNFPMQANGAEMLRLACCLATERGRTVCAPVHDALLVEGPANGIEDVVARTQAAMREASELVLPGFPLRTDAKVVRHPDRYMDERGRRMWETVWALLNGLKAEEGEVSPTTPRGYHP